MTRVLILSFLLLSLTIYYIFYLSDISDNKDNQNHIIENNILIQAKQTQNELQQSMAHDPVQKDKKNEHSEKTNEYQNTSNLEQSSLEERSENIQQQYSALTPDDMEEVSVEAETSFEQIDIAVIKIENDLLLEEEINN